MSAMSIGKVIFLVVIVALILWNIRGHRRHRDGTIEERSDVWLSDDWPAGPQS